MEVKKGECVLFTGASGCGKTSILRLINGLIPHFYSGKLSGKITIAGNDVSALSIRDISKMVGSVFQNPKSQFFNTIVKDELAFKSENYEENPEIILNTIDNTLKKYKLSGFIDRNLFSLSGGEKQKVCCLSVQIYPVPIIILDEPSSNMDILAISELIELIKNWKNEGYTILIAEHRLYYLMNLADRVIYMCDGEIRNDYKISEFRKLDRTTLENKGLRDISICRFKKNTHVNLKQNEESISFKNLYLSKDERVLLDITNLAIPLGMVVGVLGLNGAGKTTFANCLCGIEKKVKGIIEIDKRIFRGKDLLKKTYLVMQDVNHQLFTESVGDEILLSLEKEEKLSSKKVKRILEKLSLTDLNEFHPMSLSGGQKQRVAVATALIADRDIIVFDEPTSGLDYRHMVEVSESINCLKNEGKSIFLITHDLELIEKCCDYFLFFEKGKIKWHGYASKNTNEKVHEFFRLKIS